MRNYLIATLLFVWSSEALAQNAVLDKSLVKKKMMERIQDQSFIDMSSRTNSQNHSSSVKINSKISTTKSTNSISSGTFWQQTQGPNGGYFEGVAYTSPYTFAVSYGAGVFRSTDNGTTWVQMNSGLDNGYAQAIVINSSNSIFVGTTGGIYRSDDYGITWNYISTGYTMDVTALTIDGNGYIFAGTMDSGIYVSYDGGNSWYQSSTTTYYILSLTSVSSSFTSSSYGYVFAATWGGGIFRTSDGGSTWYTANTGLSVSYIQSLVTGSSGYVYAGTYLGGVYRSTNGGLSWTPTNTNLTATDIQCLLWKSNGYMYAGSADQGVFRSTNSGSTWTQLNTNLASIDIRCLGAGSGSNVFAGTSGDGMFLITDAGSSWTAVNQGLTVFIRSLAINTNGDIYAGTSMCGIYKSTNNGTNWTQLVNTPNYTFSSIAFGTNGYIYGTTGYGVYRSTDDGSTWTQVNTGLTDVYTLALSVNKNTGYVYVGGEGGVFQSTNYGNSWSKISVGITDTLVRALVINSAGYIFAGTYGGTGGIFRSTNSGASWTQINSGLTEMVIRSFAFNTSGSLFAGTAGGGIFRSLNNGSSWTAVNSGLSGTYVNSMVFDNSGYLYAGTPDYGVARSTNNGDSWADFNDGLTNSYVVALAVNSSGLLFAGTGGSGVFKGGSSTNTIPTIISFSPLYGTVGSTVSITGTNFSTTTSSNVVYFGAVRASVSSATSSSLSVTVPNGVTYRPISVMVNGLTAFSQLPFFTTYNGGVSLSNSSFGSTVDFAAGTTPQHLALGDIDNDGKPDVVVVNGTANTFSTLRNMSTTGTVSFYSSNTITNTGTSPTGLALGDIDGDGLLDVVVANGGSNTVSIFRNTSVTGVISYASAVNFSTGNVPGSVALGDIDGNGKLDIVVVNSSDNTISVLLNNSSIGSINFATKVDFAITGGNTSDIAIGEIDGDGKPDIVVGTGGTTVGVFRNTSTSGSVSMTTRQDVAISGSAHIGLVDLDGDGKLDIIGTNVQNKISIVRNTSTSGAITFTSKVDYSSNTSSDVVFGDIDGDGKVDVVVTNASVSNVSVYKNNSTSGTFNLNSKIDFTVGGSSAYGAVSDIDGDGKPDIVLENGNSISILRNTTSVSISTPNAPSNLTAAANSSSQITLNWTDNSSNEDGFKIERSTDNFATYSQIGTASSDASTYQDNTVSPSTQYFYRVAAYNTSGNSQYSNIAQATTPLPAPVASQATNVTSSSFIAQWSSSVGATSYQIDVSTNSSFTSFVSGYSNLDVGNNTSYLVQGLSASTTYHYRVRASGAGVTSANSNTVDVTTNLGNAPMINHTPPSTEVIVNSGSASPVDISASATDASGVVSMYVQYHQVNQSGITTVYFSSPYNITQTVQIPGSAFLNQTNTCGVGVDYRVVATNSLSISSATDWTSISVRNGSGTVVQPSFNWPTGSMYTEDQIQKAYTIFSVPYNLDNHIPNFVTRSLGPHQNNNVSYYNWRMQRIYNGVKQDYDQFSNQASCYPGTGFFLIIRSQGQPALDPTNDPHTIVKAYDMYHTGVTLSGGMNGWYLLGTPLNTTLSLMDSVVFVGATLLDHASYAAGWNHSVNQLAPWQGLAVKLSGPCMVLFKTGIAGGLPKNGMTPKMMRDAMPVIQPSPNDWMVRIRASRSDIKMSCDDGGFGMHNGARIDHDQFDLYEPPTLGDKTISLGFSGPDGPRVRDIRPLDENGGVWEMKLTTIDAAARVKLAFDDVSSIPDPSFEVYLFDLEEQISYNLKTTSTFEVGSGRGVKNFRVVAGKHAFVQEHSSGIALAPEHVRLYANYPNPFNPTTVIRFSIPNFSEESRVTLKVYTILGQEVATLVNGVEPAGYYEVNFNGNNLTSGVYFYQLTVTSGTQSFKEIRKMLLVK